MRGAELAPFTSGAHCLPPASVGPNVAHVGRSFSSASSPHSSPSPVIRHALSDRAHARLPRGRGRRSSNRAAAMGYSPGILEIRGHRRRHDLPKRPNSAARRLTDAQGSLAPDLVITDLGASAREPPSAIRACAVNSTDDEARRFIDLAHSLRCVLRIRVFPNEHLKDEPHDVTLARIGDTPAELGWFAKGSGVGVLRSRTATSPSRRPQRDHAARKNAPGNRARLGYAPHGRRRQGSAGDTWAAIGKWVYHTHIKGPAADGKDRRQLRCRHGHGRREGHRPWRSSRAAPRPLQLRWGESLASPDTSTGIRSGVPAMRARQMTARGCCLGRASSRLVIDKALHKC